MPQSGFFTPGRSMALGVLLMALLIGGLIYYQRAQERRQVQALKGILTDTMMQLEASNEYIAAIFDCYKSSGEALQAIRLHEEGLRDHA